MAIESDHRAFARAVVALAREHGMDNIELKFRRGIGRMSERQPGSTIDSGYYDQVQAFWTSGRHGSKDNIRMTYHGQQDIPEKEDVGDE